MYVNSLHCRRHVRTYPERRQTAEETFVRRVDVTVGGYWMEGRMEQPERSIDDGAPIGSAAKQHTTHTDNKLPNNYYFVCSVLEYVYDTS